MLYMVMCHTCDGCISAAHKRLKKVSCLCASTSLHGSGASRPRQQLRSKALGGWPSVRPKRRHNRDHGEPHKWKCCEARTPHRHEGLRKAQDLLRERRGLDYVGFCSKKLHGFVEP